MPPSRASRMVHYSALGLSFGLAVLLTSCAPPQGAPQTTMFPKTEAARSIMDLYTFIFWAAALVFIAVQGGIVYTLWRFRSRPGHELPPQVHGNTNLEVGWTVLPALVLLAVAVPTIQTIFFLEAPPAVGASGAPGGSLRIEVVGKQWWWEFRYPEQNIITANELVLPVGRTVELTLLSEDVIHSFWVPQLMGKQDVMPSHANGLWFTPEEPGQYFGQCAEYCGIQHAHMRMNVLVYTPQEFQAWVARQQGPAQPTTELAQQGAEVFAQNACVGCHAIQGTIAQARIGPDLSHFGSRTTLASGILQNTPENLAEWLRDPQAVKPGNKMPTLNLRPSEVEALVEYLHSLK